MKALLLHAVGDLRIVERDTPSPADDEVLVTVAAAGICGSDVHSARDGGLLRNPPIVMGHEFTGWAEGERVVVNPLITCGRCGRCRAGDDHLCRQRSIIGIQRPGGFAEQVTVPRRSLVPLPSEVSFTTGAVIEPLAVAWHAVRSAALSPGMRVAVLGAGPIGLLVALLCVDAGAGVTTVDLAQGRLDLAAELGAESRTDLAGEYDVTFDVVGLEATRRPALEHLRPGGLSVWVGNETPTAGFDAQDLVRTDKHIVGSAAYRRDEFETAATLVDERVAPWVVEEALDDGPALFAMLMGDQPDKPVKVVLRP